MRRPRVTYRAFDKGSLSRVEGTPPEQVAIGARVRVAFVTEDGAPLAVFRPQEESR